MNYVGAAAAGTLGYIAGDLPGAYAAYKIYNNFARKKSYPNSMKRKFTPNAPGSRKKTTGKWLRSKRPSKWARIVDKNHFVRPVTSSLYKRKPVLGKYVLKPKLSKQMGRTSNVSTGLRKKTIQHFHHPKGAKKVYVSRALRKKVSKVIEGKDPKGFAQYVNSGRLVPPATDNAQSAALITGCNVDGVTTFFSPTQINNVASSLWNHKTITYTPVYNDNENFPYATTKIKVLKQWVTVKFRNNTQRNCYLILYACENKVKRAATSFVTEWTASMTEENTATINVNNTSPLTMYATPYMSKQLMNNWSVETTRVYLKPGEEYVYTLQGPSKLYDFRKYFTAGAEQTMPRGVMQLAYSMREDILGDNAGAFGRLISPIVNGYGCFYEVNEYFKLEIPQQAGIQWLTASSGASSTSGLPSSGFSTYLGAKRDAYLIAVNLASTHTGTLVRSDIEQPGTLETPNPPGP